MTFNYKALLLVLLTSLALGAYAHSSRSQCDCEKKERTFCKETCCDKDICKEDCKAEPASPVCDCCLSFEQTIFEVRNATGDKIRPRPFTDKPHGVCGRFKICFAPDFSHALYELKISGLQIEKFPNQRPFGARLFFGTATNVPGFGEKAIEDSRIADLCGLGKDGGTNPGCVPPTTPCAIVKNGKLCCKAILTNEQLNIRILETETDSATIPTIAALAQACRAGKVFVLVNGNACDDTPNATQYDVESGGLLRCQLSGKEVAGVTANGTGSAD